MLKTPKLHPLTSTEIQLVEMAKNNLAFVQAQPDRLAALKDMFSKADTVHAVYEDASHSSGIGIRFILGEHHVRSFMDRGTPTPSRIRQSG